MTRRLVATAGQASLSCRVQGVTIDFWGGPQLHLWPQATGGPAPLARMYREQLGRRGRGLYATYELPPGLKGLSFETEEY